MKPTRIAVIGIGHLGKIHTKLWRDFASTFPETLHLSALYDTHYDRAHACARELALAGTLGSEPHICLNLEEVLERADAVTIVSPTSTHFAIARECLRSGKHCFIEKPMTTTSAEARQLADEGRERGLTVHVGQVERFNPAVQALTRRQTPFQPLFIEAHRLAQFKPRATDVSVILDLMIHDIDLALWLTRSPVEEIHASGAAIITGTTDIANVRLHFADGCVANLTASRLSAKQMRTMHLFGRDTCYSLDFAEASAEAFYLVDAGESLNVSNDNVPASMLGDIEAARQSRFGTKAQTIWYEKPVLTPLNAIQEEQRSFVHALRGEKDNNASISATAEEAVAAMQVAERISEQIARNLALFGKQ